LYLLAAGDTNTTLHAARSRVHELCKCIARMSDLQISRLSWQLTAPTFIPQFVGLQACLPQHNTALKHEGSA